MSKAPYADALEALESSRTIKRMARARLERLNRRALGAVEFFLRFPDRAQSVAQRGLERALRAENAQRELVGGVTRVRDLRYRSGPWDPGADELLPVSWFLLWRSNIDWVPDPVNLRRESRVRALTVERGCPKRPPRERPPKLSDSVFKPARKRIRPRDAFSLRGRTQTEE